MKKDFSAKRAVYFLLLCFFMFTICKGKAYAEEVSKTNIYHIHTGNSKGGGCFGMPKYCGGPMKEQTLNPHGCGISAVNGGCVHCGCWYEPPSAVYPSGCAHCNCPRPNVIRCSKCGTDGRGGICKRVTQYESNCGKNESSLIATLSLLKSTKEWCKELYLEVIPEILDNSEINLSPQLVWNHEEPGENRQIKVEKNGTYRCECYISQNGINKVIPLEVVINNIDITPPHIEMIEEESEFVKERLITIKATDLQEDNSNGVGLHENAYSVDGGENWMSEPLFSISENKVCKITVRDKLENISQIELPVSNIDRYPPTFQLSLSEKKIVVQAEDLQPDGTQGCGLAEEAYSYDGGNTWIRENIFMISNPGEYKIAVADKLGNIAYETISIEAEKKEEVQKEAEPKAEIPKQQVIPNENKDIEEQIAVIDKNPLEKIIREEISLSNNQMPKETKIVKTKKNNDIPQIILKKIPKEKPLQKRRISVVAVVSALSVVSLIFMISILYLWYISVIVYEYRGKNKRYILGVTFLWKEDTYFCKITDEMKERALTNTLELHFNPLFSKSHYLEKIVIQTEEHKKTEEIMRKILLRMP